MDRFPLKMALGNSLPAANPVENVTQPVQGASTCPSPQSPLLASWPKSAQWTVAVLLGGVVVLLGFHALAGLRAGTRPSEHLETEGPIFRLDLNRARAAELGQIEGVGPKLAERIVAHRRRHGPFRTIDALRQVPGIGPKTFTRIKPWVCVETAAASDTEPSAISVKPAPAQEPVSLRWGRGNKEAGLIGTALNVNEAPAAELQRLPGIGKVKSQRIIDERAKGPFKSVDELRRVKGIGPKTLAKIRPYVTVETPSAPIASTQPK